MIRKDNEFIKIEDVLSSQYFEFDEPKLTPKRVMFNGDMVKMCHSLRLRTFYSKGTTCVKCGLKASYFVKEKFMPKDKYHLNLYGINEDGKEVLFTHDHILPKAKGGKDKLSNTQTMCCYCNWEKADNIE